MNKCDNWISYLSGNFIIAIIFFISNSWDFYNNKGNFYVFLLSGTLLIVTILAAIYIIRTFNHRIKQLSLGRRGTEVQIDNLKIKGLFSTGAMTYYILPFASFATGDDEVKNAIALFILIFFFGLIYVHNKMILYTPVLGLYGYSTFSCTTSNIRRNDSENIIKLNKDILVKDCTNIILGETYLAQVQDLNENTKIAVFK